MPRKYPARRPVPLPLPATAGVSPPGASSIRRRSASPEDTAGAPTPHERYLRLEPARAEREWLRYQGTAQRRLFRDLRERFLARHAGDGTWSLDVGSGPGRFTALVGHPADRHVALDLSRSMLAEGQREANGPAGAGRLEPVVGDALQPPFAEGRFGTVALLGNSLGFEGPKGPRLLAAAEALVQPGGLLMVEIAPGPGERSRYLGRLPAGAVRRLVAAPPAAVALRVRREGFVAEPVRHRSGSFRRWAAPELRARWATNGWELRETVAVAPALGPDAARLEAIAQDARSWARLLELEELLGREPGRWRRAAAVLVAARRARVPGFR
jgi:SAM-dependent methyltransferase